MEYTQQYFSRIFDNAKANAIIIMNDSGIIQRVNKAFTTAFGHTTEDLESKHFRILFTDKDQKALKPETEINLTCRNGSSNDENYVMHKDGSPIWVTGETILVQTDEATSIVKLIFNIHAQMQLERYLLNNQELLENLFTSIQQSGLLIIDSMLKVIKVNQHFRNLFHVTGPIAEGSSLQQFNHPFWSSSEIKEDLRKVIVNTTPLFKKSYLVNNGNKDFVRVHITSKAIVGDDGVRNRILLVIKAE